MDHPTTILYVADPLRSAAFYEKVLGCAPAEASPGFAMFVTPAGFKLGLWKRADVRPAAAEPGGSELCFTLADRAAVDAAHAAWRADGLPVTQAPVAMDFGYTCATRDPDGHRLRVFHPAA